MNELVQKTANREINRAITADEFANAHYYRILKRFISGKLAVPEARLDMAGLKEIDAAWLILHNTSKNLRRAYMKLYVAYL